MWSGYITQLLEELNNIFEYPLYLGCWSVSFNLKKYTSKFRPNVWWGFIIILKPLCLQNDEHYHWSFFVNFMTPFVKIVTFTMVDILTKLLSRYPPQPASIVYYTFHLCDQWLSKLWRILVDMHVAHIASLLKCYASFCQNCNEYWSKLMSHI